MFAAFSVLAGLVVLAFDIREVMLWRRLGHDGIRTGGHVVHHIRRSSGPNVPPARIAVVQFVDVRGGRHTFEARSSGVRGLPVGGAVPVRYLPDVPASARIDLAGRRIGEVAALSAFGTLLLALGIWMLATGR